MTPLEHVPSNSKIVHLSLLSLLSGLLVCSLINFGSPSGKDNNRTTKLPVADSSDAETFQELGFFGPIKKDKWKEFLRSVQTNILNSRREPGNISFALYQPATGERQPIWFERFQNKKAHALHKEQNYFKAAIQVIQQSLEQSAHSIELKTIHEIPVTLPIISNSPTSTRQVITLFEVRPDKINLFIKHLSQVAVAGRKAAGNLEFNVYRYAASPNQFALLESWNSSLDHAAYWRQEHRQRLATTTQRFLTADSTPARWVVVDISQ